MATKRAETGRAVGAMIEHNKVWLEATIASVGEGLISTNENGTIIRMNQAALNILGYKKQDVLGKRFIDKIVALYDNGQVIDTLDRPIAKVFLTGETISERAVYRGKDGRLVPVAVTVAPVLVGDKPVGAIEVFRDLTTEIENEKLKSDFISIASHQLRTPLSAISMYTRMLGDGMVGEMNEQQSEYIKVILGSVDRMNELISTLLNITRIEAGGLSVSPQPLQLIDIISSILDEFKPLAAEKHIGLSHSMDIDLDVVTTDSLLIKEVFANLISNAIKYTPDGGAVTVSVDQTDRDVTFRITDTGYGIPEPAQKHIFSKFFRADNITKQDVSGTGLGLYLIKIIAEKLGGELWFESRENLGSTFYFTLPKDS